MAKNILVSTLGASWQIIPETIGVFNHSKDYDFYKNRAEKETFRDKIDFKLDEVWLVMTDDCQKTRDGDHVKEKIGKIREWNKNYLKAEAVKIRYWILKNVPDIKSEKDDRHFHSLVLRLVAYAKTEVDGGKLILSLACGRKTMSANMQDAAYCFGCDMMMHVIGDSHCGELPMEKFANMDKKNVVTIVPLFLGKCNKNESLDEFVEKNKDEFSKINASNPKEEDIDGVCWPGEDAFLGDIVNRLGETRDFYTSYYLAEKTGSIRNNFKILFTLTKSNRDWLNNTKIGCDKASSKEELALLSGMPKVDLHCHLGGVLSPSEMVEAALTLKDGVTLVASENQKFRDWLESIKESVVKKDFVKPAEGWKCWRNTKATELSVDESLIVPAFLQQFEKDAEYLDSLIFGEKIDEKAFCEIGIKKYEALGDLQGSALLKHEKTLRKNVQILLKNSIKENVRYLEIRCSPVNYENQTENFSRERVVECILEELEKEKERIDTSVIFIASRHGNPEKIKDTFKLVDKLNRDELFTKYFRGYDLAGNEEKMSPREMREQFLNALKNCPNITIHAGETMPAESIWEAIYHLNAERIGHGLTLNDDPSLLEKVLERRIGVEMCPSSNYQIVGFRDNYFPEQDLKTYPLKGYLDKGVRVCVNTDDPGISRTNVTKELLRAARLTPGGLSLMEILYLEYNALNAAFYPFEKKKELFNEFEKEIVEWIREKENKG